MNEFDFPRIGVGVAIRRNNEILLHQRKSAHAFGTWAFPGGHLEKWETFAGAAKRELEEEAGKELIVSQPKLWTVVNTLFTEEDKHYVLIMMISDWISGEAIQMEPDKNAGWDWFTWDNLPSPLILGLQIMEDRGLNPFQADLTLLSQ